MAELKQTPYDAQSMSVKRAEVEFHNFASLGEPERASRVYAEENTRRKQVLDKHFAFLHGLSPFLEIGANAGHTSYLLANDYGADGFALDISADSLRWGIVLQEKWRMARAPIRVAGDAVRLPFADNSMRVVLACQMLSQFMNIESVFIEVKRVLQPGGVFIFMEEPLRRRLSLRLYRAPYEEQMKPWEKTLHHSGLLGYLVKDVIGAHQEESFGIRQNHTMGLQEWGELIARHFVAAEYEIFVPQRGWGETLVRRAVSTPNPEQTLWRTAKLLGGTLAAFCRKEGAPPEANFDLAARFEELLRCPDCGGSLRRNTTDTLYCTECPYSAANEGGVFNLLASADKKELYPGDRPDILDFSQPSHADHLGEGWHEVEGVYGNRYRWIGPRAIARLQNVRGGPQRLRLRGFAPEPEMRGGKPVHLQIFANGQPAGVWDIDRPGLFVVEHNLPDCPGYEIEICATPVWQAPPDPRQLTLNLSMIRLVPPE